MKPLRHIMIKALALMLCLPGISMSARLSKSNTPSLLMPATTLLQQVRQNQAPFMVDVRPKNEYSRFKIPGSLNIPESLIKTKAFLKTGPMVLIHSGIAHAGLLSLAKKLTTKGFKVSVLEGGLAAWKHKGGPIVGNPFAIRQMNTITPKTLFAGQAKEDWLIIDMSAPPPGKSTIPGAAALPPGDPARLNRFLSANPPGDATSIIIMDDAGEDYPRIFKELPQEYRHRTFGLSGGLKAFQKFKTRHMLANRPKKERIVETGTCEPCKKKKNQ